MSSTQPIGLLDSGFGGLSVMSAIREEFPNEDLIYAADCACAPWGDREESFILERVNLIVNYLLERGIKALVLACNTATAVAADSLRARLQIPVIGIEPAVLPAARATFSKVIGVLATVKTIESERYQRLKTLVENPAVEILDCPCPGLMECVEAGEFHTPNTRELIKKYILPLISKGADQLVLGCTHYPFLSDEISRIAGEHVMLVNPAPAVARHMRTVLTELNALTDNTTPGSAEYLVTGANAEREQILQFLAGPQARLNNLVL